MTDQAVVNRNARIVALDVGSKRIGVASANVVARLASPLQTLEVGDRIEDDVIDLLASQTASALVVGLPRGLQGQDTAQTEAVRQFIDKLKPRLSVPIYWQDEALTSHLSKLELKTKKGQHSKGEVDALAATYILEDYLAQQEVNR
ncbi:MAG: Holliday junction resolvase RuvX [Candidatus Saccharimonadales bacterium]